MKYCAKCGKELEHSVNFCPNCGTETNSVSWQEKAKRVVHTIFSNKKLVAVLLAVVLVLAFASRFNVKARVVDTWEGGPLYLEKYGGNCWMEFEVKKDGTYNQRIYNMYGNVVHSESGEWWIEGFSLKYREKNRSDWGNASITYHPIQNILWSGYETTWKLSRK